MSAAKDSHCGTERIVNYKSIIQTAHKIQCFEKINGFSYPAYYGGPPGTIEHGN